MVTLDEDFEFLLEMIEHSRLPHRKQMSFARLLLDRYESDVTKLADKIRSGATKSIEIAALTGLSGGGAGEASKSQRDMYLTYDQRIIKDATDQVKNG